MKIYTKTGDNGSTGLPGGSRVAKNDLRIDCYGAVDELNASVGLAASADATACECIQRVQGELFVIGSRLTMPAASNLPELHADSVGRLEREIDEAESHLSPLRNFILPGGCELAARLHVARTICRRAERLLVELHSRSGVEPAILTYMNRLSDWLFVQARLANHRAGTADIPWVASR